MGGGGKNINIIGYYCDFYYIYFSTLAFVDHHSTLLLPPFRSIFTKAQGLPPQRHWRQGGEGGREGGGGGRGFFGLVGHQRCLQKNMMKLHYSNRCWREGRTRRIRGGERRLDDEQDIKKGEEGQRNSIRWSGGKMRGGRLEGSMGGEEAIGQRTGYKKGGEGRQHYSSLFIILPANYKL